MKKISISNLKTGKTYEACFDTQDDLNSWKNKHIQKNTWGYSERWVLDTEENSLTDSQKSTSLDSREVTITEQYEKIEYDIHSTGVNEYGEPTIIYNLDENGDPIILSQETVPAVTGIEYLLPSDYTITELDSDNGYFDIQDAYSELRDLRDKYLAETDFTQLPDAPVDATLRSRYVEYRSYLRALPSNYTDQNITSFQVMTFSEWRSQMYPGD